MLFTDKNEQAEEVSGKELSVGESQMLSTDKIEQAEEISKSFREKIVRGRKSEAARGQNEQAKEISKSFREKIVRGR